MSDKDLISKIHTEFFTLTIKRQITHFNRANELNRLLPKRMYRNPAST
jgi:hypothetical protein